MTEFQIKAGFIAMHLLAKFEKNRQKIINIFDRNGVIIAYLFGSGSSEGKDLGPLSDLDFGVKFRSSLTEAEKQELHLKILSQLISILGDEIDLVIMNDAGILLQFSIIKKGEVLFKRSEKEKVKLESRIIQEYLDTKYYRKRHTNEKISKLAKRGFK